MTTSTAQTPCAQGDPPAHVAVLSLADGSTIQSIPLDLHDADQVAKLSLLDSDVADAHVEPLATLAILERGFRYVSSGPRDLSPVTSDGRDRASRDEGNRR